MTRKRFSEEDILGILRQTEPDSRSNYLLAKVFLRKVIRSLRSDGRGMPLNSILRPGTTIFGVARKLSRVLSVQTIAVFFIAGE